MLGNRCFPGRCLQGAIYGEILCYSIHNKEIHSEVITIEVRIYRIA